MKPRKHPTTLKMNIKNGLLPAPYSPARIFQNSRSAAPIIPTGALIMAIAPTANIKTNTKKLPLHGPPEFRETAKRQPNGNLSVEGGKTPHAHRNHGIDQDAQNKRKNRKTPPATYGPPESPETSKRQLTKNLLERGPLSKP